jgi:ankyrin repeat protein
MLSKFLENEKKSGLGKLRKGWGMMFADSDIEKIRDSLNRNREALRMSALVFRWSLGDVKVDSSQGIGYTALAAALERINSNVPTSIAPVPELHEHHQPHSHASLNERSSHPNLSSPAPVHRHDELPALPVLPPFTMSDRGQFNARHDSLLEALSLDLDRQSLKNTTVASVRSGKHGPDSSVKEIRLGRHESSGTETVYEDNVSIKTLETLKEIEDMIHHEEQLMDRSSSRAVRLKVDVTAVPRASPKQTSGANSTALKSALTNAVQQRKHKMIEQLLDCGVPTDNGQEINLLKEAVLNRDVESVRLLLLFGADPNRIDVQGLTPLLSATQTSFIEAAKLLIKYGADADLSAGPEGESPLALAVEENRMDFVQLYLTYGGDATSVMSSGCTAFIKAINKRTPRQLIELMLSYGVDPNAKDGEGKTALFEAIQSRRMDLLNILLEAKADPNLPGPKHPLWPSTYQPKALQALLNHGADYKKCPGLMELATSVNNMESLQILLKAGVDPNAKKDGVYTPLCSAIRDNRAEIVSVLLANGADPNVPASEYPTFKCVTHNRVHFLPQLVAAGADLHTPKGIIEKAVEHNNKEALRYLLEKNVSPNDRSPEGHTALTTAIRENRVDVVDLLLAHGADPGVRGENWPICMAVKRPEILAKLLPKVHNPRAVKGVIEMAVVADQLQSVKLLLKAGVSVEDKNGGVFSPLTTALREDRKGIVKFLLNEGGADVNSPGEHLPIVKALRRFHNQDTDYIEMLLNKGADPNLMYRGWNGILQAVENGDAKVLKLLVTKGGGADLNATTDEGRTVMDIVTERGWDEAIGILLSNSKTRKSDELSLSSKGAHDKWTLFPVPGAPQKTSQTGLAM